MMLFEDAHVAATVENSREKIRKPTLRPQAVDAACSSLLSTRAPSRPGLSFHLFTGNEIYLTAWGFQQIACNAAQRALAGARIEPRIEEMTSPICGDQDQRP